MDIRGARPRFSTCTYVNGLFFQKQLTEAVVNLMKHGIFFFLVNDILIVYNRFSTKSTNNLFDVDTIT